MGRTSFHETKKKSPGAFQPRELLNIHKAFMPDVFHYEIYDQHIHSEIPIRSLTPLTVGPEDKSAEAADICIVLGKTPASLRREPVHQNVCTSMGQNEFLFFHEKLGVRFYVENGNKITVDQDYYSNPDTVSVYLLGSILSAALYMQGTIPMHASSVMTDHGAVLFTGASGSGKSTLAHGLQRRGYTPITDDVAPIRILDGHPHVLPGYPNFKLWEESLKFYDVEDHSHPRVRDSLQKYYVPCELPFCKDACKIHKIYHLVSHNEGTLLSLERTDKEERFLVLKKNVFRPNYVKGLKKEMEHLLTVARLAHLPLTTIKRPHSLGGSIEDYLDTVEKDMLG